MSELRIATLPLAAFGCAVALIACGSTSSASTPASAGGTPTAYAHVAQANPVAVSPEPGTPDASPATQISFLGGAGTKVADVSVKGSSSGAHSGVLRAYSTGTGESFLPTHPFTPGERVTVHATITAGPSTGSVTTSFTIAHQYAVSQKQFPINPGDSRDIQHYSTAPALAPSTVQILTPAKAGASPGDLFLAPYQGKGVAGPMITDQAGNLIWFHPLPANVAATNFRVEEYEGKPVLAWWQGRILEVGFGQGEVVLANSSYEQIAHIRAGNGYHEDLHEIRITPEGTAWIDAFDPIRMNLSSVHGSANGIINDSVVEEVDIKTGLVMWEWHAIGHIPLSESRKGLPSASSSPWDYVHINSVDPGTSGDLLVSSRSTWTLYDLSLHTGAINWRLGGSRSNFKGSSSTRTFWQHDAEFQPGGQISVFDNGSDPPEEKQSRGLILSPNLSSHTVTLVKAFTNPSRTLLASSQGSMISLPGGNWLMGYGGLPDFTEFSAAGHVLLDGRLGKNVQDFRTYLSPWNGQPKTAPAVLVKAAGATMSVSVSWNGATQVASWRVLAGASSSSLATAATAAKSGFQTTISASTHGPYVQVQALDGAGNVLGTSAVVKG